MSAACAAHLGRVNLASRPTAFTSCEQPVAPAAPACPRSWPGGGAPGAAGHLAPPRGPARWAGLGAAQLRRRTSPHREPECGRGFISSVLRSRAKAKQRITVLCRRRKKNSQRDSESEPAQCGDGVTRKRLRRRRRRRDCGTTVVVTAAAAATTTTAAAQGLSDGAKITVQDLPVRRTLGRGEGEGTEIGQAIADGDSED